MRIVFTGGGTAGHIFPNIAVIETLKEHLKCDLFYIGVESDRNRISKYSVPFYAIKTGKWRRYFDLKNIIDLFKIPMGFMQAVFLLAKLKPDLVFSKGGYVSVPVVLAAALRKIPVWIHESDVSPGLATRICQKFAKRIFLSFPESLPYFSKTKAIIQVTGNPIRPEILKGDKNKGYQLTNFSPARPVILIMGGSSGAQSLNKIVIDILPVLLKQFQVIHVTGKLSKSNKKFLIKYEKHPHYQRFDFLNEELPHCYAISNLIVSRAGSGSLFEALALKKHLILIPLPASASRGDQIENAAIAKNKKWATVVSEDQLTNSLFLSSIKKTLVNKQKWLKKPLVNAAETIVCCLISLYDDLR